jgi:hypothetical protein
MATWDASRDPADAMADRLTTETLAAYHARSLGDWRQSPRVESTKARGADNRTRTRKPRRGLDDL